MSGAPSDEDAKLAPSDEDAKLAPSDEDAKLVVLARGAMARAAAATGAAVRDTDGRSYAGAPVGLRALTLTALQVALATAIASGATGFEAAVLVAGEPDDAGVDALRELSPQAAVLTVDRAGQPR